MFRDNQSTATPTLTVYLQMFLSFYNFNLVVFFIILSPISGSTLGVTSGSSLTAGPYPKFFDVVGCAPEYGENLQVQACYRALQTMPDGFQFSQFVSRKSYAGQEALITPVYYYDNNSESLRRTSLDPCMESLSL